MYINYNKITKIISIINHNMLYVALIKNILENMTRVPWGQDKTY